MLCCD